MPFADRVALAWSRIKRNLGDVFLWREKRDEHESSIRQTCPPGVLGLPRLGLLPRGHCRVHRQTLAGSLPGMRLSAFCETAESLGKRRGEVP
jgi:hypothetical protein